MVTSVDKTLPLVMIKNEILSMQIKNVGGSDIKNKSTRTSQLRQLHTVSGR